MAYKKQSKVSKFKETYIFEYKGINILVRIDYLNNKISLVESTCNGGTQIKKWKFNDRGVEYMQGWINILEAMQEAVKDAEKRYEADANDKAKDLDKKLEDILNTK